MIGSKNKEVWCIAGVLLLAFLLRMYALAFLPSRPVTDDAYEYYYIAQHILPALQGEPVEDKDKFLSFAANRGWLYPLFIAGVNKIFSPRLRYVLAVQVVAGSLTCLLIYLIGSEIFHRKTGIAAALCSAVYPGFIFYTAALFQETTSLFFLALSVFFLCRAISHRSLPYYFWAGFFVTLVSFYRSGFILFFFVASPFLLWVLRGFYKNYFMRYFLYFLFGSICMFVIYGAIAYRLGGTLFLEKPTYVWNFYEPLHRDGWVSDIFGPTPSKELEDVAREKSFPAPKDGQALTYPSEVYLLAGIRYIRNRPLECLSQLLKRLTRMWMYVETYPGRWHSPVVFAQMLFHWCLIFLALAGITLALNVWYKSWIIYFIFFYVTAVSIPIIGLPRYALPAMPFVIILAAYVLCTIIDILKNEGKGLVSFVHISSVAFAVVITVVIFYLGTPFLLKLFANMTPVFCHNFTILLINIMLAILACLGCWFFYLRLKSFKRAFFVSVFPCIALMLLYSNTAFTSKTWHEWSATMDSVDQKVRQTILLSDDFDYNTCRQARLMIDMFPGGGAGYNFKISVNGQQIKTFQDGIKAKEKKFDKNLGGLYKSFFFNAYGLTPEDLRQWYEVELPLHLLRNTSKLVIECSLAGTMGRDRNRVIVFGDYKTLPDVNLFEGPCFPRNETDTSMFKVMPYSGDYRFEKVTVLRSKMTMSEYYNGFAWQSKDLSDLPGIQSGSYRIRIELIGMDGSQIIL